MRRGPWPALLGSLLLSAAALALLLAFPADFWNALRPATCLAQGGCFCEAPAVASPLRQPVNSISSLAYVFTACWIFFDRRRGDFPERQARLLALACLVTGLGSAFYHASLTFSGQFFDIFGMCLLAGLMLVYAWERRWRWSAWRSLAVYLLLLSALTLLQIAWPESRRWAFALLLLAALGFEIPQSRRSGLPAGPLWQGLALFALAYGVWLLDNSGLLCAPHSPLQGHAVWHLLGAAAGGLLYRYYRGSASVR